MEHCILLYGLWPRSMDYSLQVVLVVSLYRLKLKHFEKFNDTTDALAGKQF
jgi:hypothetical protein